MDTSSLDLSTSRLPAAARILLGLLSRLQVGRLQVSTPEGETLHFGRSSSAAAQTLEIRDWQACARILRSGDIGFAEAYRDGQVDTADLTGLLRLALQNEALLDRALFGGKLAAMWHRLKFLLRRNSKRGSRRNIHAHYDIGNEFYRLWLDESWTYSSALFGDDQARAAMPLHEAQQRKYQRILDVLSPQPGSRLLEIGCGWGGFAELALDQGHDWTGVTISQAQHDWARARLSRFGGKGDLRLTDYRDLEGQFDGIVSIEMFEAVGMPYWSTYFRQVARLLKPGGEAVVQSITIDDARFERYAGGTDFIQQFIFPGGMLPSPERFEAEARKAGLEVVGQMAFGLDYAETLRRWRQAFEAALPEVRAQGFDEAFIRIWRLYLCYCEAGFDERRTDVVQFHLRKLA
ncbi:MAG: class I SAM-dependent methyltransferase [Burkholderiaceae bacterium]|nr:MAG: class I SAM-dependent methyltransferase [Burkholderiaceae bacterium]